MKKILMFAAMGAAMMSASAQTTYNYFDPADCDADGWLWFDTQEKIDKYVDFYSSKNIGSAAPRIYLVSATFENADGEYAEPYADPDIEGYNAEGVEGGEGSLTGAIVLSPASSSIGSDAPNGGGFVIWLPDCAEYSISLSQEVDRVQFGLSGGMGWIADIDCNKIYSYMGMSWGTLQPYAKVFQCVANNLQDVENKNDVSCKKWGQTSKVTTVLRSNESCLLLIHGIRILTYTKPDYNASVGELAAGDAAVEYFDMAGVRVSGSEPGMYIRRQGADVRKVVVK